MNEITPLDNGPGPGQTKPLSNDESKSVQKCHTTDILDPATTPGGGDSMGSSGEHIAVSRVDRDSDRSILPIKPDAVDVADVKFRPGREPSRLRLELYRPGDLPSLKAAGHKLYVLPDGQVIVLRAFVPED